MYIYIEVITLVISGLFLGYYIVVGLFLSREMIIVIMIIKFTFLTLWKIYILDLFVLHLNMMNIRDDQHQLIVILMSILIFTSTTIIGDAQEYSDISNYAICKFLRDATYTVVVPLLLKTCSSIITQ